MNPLDPQILANALTNKIDRDLSNELDGILADAETPEEIFRLLWVARKASTVNLLTHLIVLLPEADRECIVKLFKLRPDVI
jgi:hypothetical protein